MSREVHVRLWESAEVRLPRATHLPLSRLEQIAARSGMPLPRLWRDNQGEKARQSG